MVSGIMDRGKTGIGNVRALKMLYLEVPNRQVSKQQLLWMDLHEFLCIDCSFSET